MEEVDEFSSDDFEIKQKYLNEEIIEKNYDPNLFTVFCESQKEPNLDLWTLEELKICVEEFKKGVREGRITNKKQGSTDNKEQITNEESAQYVNKNNDFESNLIECAKLGPSELSTAVGLEVLISEPKLIEEGFFSSNFVTYTVKTLPFEWEVVREFSDFVWLREVTVNNFPGIFIPPLPNMKTRGNLDEKTLCKRQKCLYKFMQGLISHPLILRNEHLRIFLKQSSTQDFKDYIRSAKCEKIDEISNFPSLEGKIVGNLQDYSEKVYNLGEYYEKSAKIMKKLKAKAYEMVENIKEANEDILKLAEVAQKLEEIQNAFVFTEKYGQIYRSLTTKLIQVSENQMKKIEMVNDHLGIFFKYFSMQRTSLKRFIEHNEGYNIVYRKALIKQSEYIDKLRIFFAYYNSQNIKETNRMNEYVTRQSYKNFYEFSVKHAQLANDLQNVWKSFLDSIEVAKPN